MNPTLRALIKLDRFLARGEGAALILITSVMTIVVFLQVVFRYVWALPLYWSEEMARYLFVWLSVLGAALGVQKGGHFSLDFFYRMMPESNKKFMRGIVYLLMEAVVLIILVQGIHLVQKTSLQESPAMAVSMAWAYASLPVGAGLMAIHLLVIFIKDVLNDRLTKKT